MYELFWAAGQQRNIADATLQATKAETKADQTHHYINELENRLENLCLKCQAMWEILREATELTDDDIQQRILEIDCRDGTEDGKMTKQVRTCPACNRPVGKRHSVCLYCGRPMGEKEVFET